MKKLSQNKNLKIVAATSVTLFSLLTVFSATFAWFSMNEQVGNNGQQVKVQTISGYFHKLSIHNAVTVSDTEYRFDTNPWGTVTIDNWHTRELITSFNTDACFMGSYDYLEKIHPVLFLFELGDDTIENYTATSQEPIIIKASTNTNYYLGDGDDDRTIYPKDDIDVDNGKFNPLSSVVRFSTDVFASTDALDAITSEDSVTLSDVTYDTYDFAATNLTSAGSFAKFDSTDSYSSFDQEPVIYSTSSATVKYVAVIFDYYELAVETIYGAFLGNDVLSDALSFTCDWTMVI